MKKPLLEDYSLTEDDLEWAVTREKEIDNLSYKKFLPKIWMGLFSIGVILYMAVLIIAPTTLNCAQFPSCLTVEAIFIRFSALDPTPEK